MAENAHVTSVATLEAFGNALHRFAYSHLGIEIGMDVSIHQIVGSNKGLSRPPAVNWRKHAAI